MFWTGIMTMRDIGVCLHHRQAPDQPGHVHRLVRCNTGMGSSFTSHEKSSGMTKLKFVRWRRMWLKPRIINDPVVTPASGGQLKPAHWGETRTAVPPQFSWQRRARTGGCFGSEQVRACCSLPNSVCSL